MNHTDGIRHHSKSLRLHRPLRQSELASADGQFTVTRYGCYAGGANMDEPQNVRNLDAEGTAGFDLCCADLPKAAIQALKRLAVPRMGRLLRQTHNG